MTDGTERTETSESRLPDRRRVTLTGISSRAWEHPADRGALTALRELKGFDEVLKALNGAWNERAWRLEMLGSAIRVDHRQYPRVFRLFAEAGATLDVAELPELYVQLDRGLQSSCIGLRTPLIVISSGAIELLDDDELRILLGHELGHLLSGHALYRTMLTTLARWSTNVAWIPGGALVIRALSAAMYEWWRKAELSADRAGLLAGQDPAAALRLFMKSAGGGDLSEIDTTAFLEQAAEYDRGGDLRDSILKLRKLAWRTHPLAVGRAADLRRWVDEGDYRAILAGTYPRRADDASASASDDARAAAESYRESFERSEDPLANLVRRVGDGATGAGDWVAGSATKLRDWMGARTTTGSSTATPPGSTADPADDNS